MICNRTESGWEVIYQQAHALLAMQLIQHWNPAERPDRWAQTLGATLEHDNGWQEWESGDRLTSVNTPRNFTETPVPDLLAQSERAITRAWHQSLWEGLLVSRHVSHLYRRLRTREPEIDAMLKEQTAQRARWRRQLGVKQAEVDHAYALLRWGDTFSLILCQHLLPFDERALEIGEGPDGTRYDVHQRADGTLAVTPWPYDVDRFDVEVNAYALGQLTFESSGELAEALHEAPFRLLQWRLQRGT